MSSLVPAMTGDRYEWVGFEADCGALDCLDDETVVALAEGALDGDARTEALLHVESCATCSALVGQAARLGSSDRPVLGRYRTIEQIGVGGMGRVYLAHDPALDREVALKLVDIGALDPAVRSARLVKEARTLAGLDHPAICRVFDIQQHDGTVFIAMELVRGRTFADWFASKPDAAALVSAFMRAGEGLAAAHEAGIVHRDFKPANVMIADDVRGELGRVVVLDFGLARREHAIELHVEQYAATDPDDGRRTGSAFAGTPVYMAPEQHEGVATAASDQYSFCLALVEGLVGRFPFPDRELFVLRRAKLDRKFLDGVVEALPASLRAPLLRGLEPDPTARFPDMRALLDALGRSSRTRGLFYGAVAVVVLFGAVAVYGLTRPSAVQCDRADESVAEVWSAERRAALQEAFARSGAPGSSELGKRVESGLDGHAERIATAYRDACVAAQFITAALFDARARCLDRRLRELDAAMAALQQLDAKTASSALAVVDGLTDVDRCADEAVLLAMDPVPDDARVAARVEAMQADLDRAEGELRVGRHREALPMFERAVEDARASAHDPLVAEALAGLAVCLRRLDDPRAVAIAEEAHGRARLVRDDASAARAAIELVYSAHRRGALDEAASWADEAEIDAERANVPRLRALVLDASAAIAYAHDDFEHALALRREALQIYAAIDPNGEAYAGELRMIANTLLRQQNLAEALETATEARAVLVALLGTESARVAEVESELGTIHMLNGRPELGIPYFERGLPIVAQQEGERSRSMFSERARLAAVYREAGRFADSAEQSRKGIELLEHIEHSPREAAIVWMNLAKTLVKQAEPAAALEAYEKARGILEAEEGAAPLQDLIIMNLVDSADVLHGLGREQEASVLKERVRVLSAAHR